MKNQTESEWVAVYLDRKLETHWPGRLIISENSMHIETINFCEQHEIYNSFFDTNSEIYGYIDFQKPATFYNCFISETGGITYADGYAPRAKIKLTINEFIIGEHIKNKDENTIFGIKIYGDGVNAFVFHELFNYKISDKKFDLTIEKTSIETSHQFGNLGFNLISSFRTSQSKSRFSISRSSYIEIIFSSPISLINASNNSQIILSVLNFFIGFRPKLPITKFYVDYTKLYLKEEWRSIEYKFTQNGNIKYDNESDTPLFDINHSHLLCEACENFFNGYHDDILLFLRVVTSCEMRDGTLLERFTQIVGCMQQFYEKNIIRKRSELIRCLNFLFDDFTKAGFRGSPDRDRIKHLRDCYAHGKLNNISNNDAQFIGIIIPFLCAVSRYHIFKFLGLERDEIAAAFARRLDQFGRFAPTDAIR